MNYGTKSIVKIIINKIKSEELKADEKLPSEQQLSIYYNVSRIVATRVFQELIKLGAIYSIQRQGYFVSFNLPNLATSLIDEYQIDDFHDEIKDFPMNKFIKDSKWEIKNPLTIERKYFKKNVLIIMAQHWIDKSIDFLPNITKLTSDLKSSKLNWTSKIVRFEPDLLFNQTKNLICYRIVYDIEHKIKWVTRYVVDPKVFYLNKLEFNL